MAIDAFLFITGITGSGPGGAIEINSFSFGASNPGTVGSGSGGGAGKVSLSDLTITKTVDSSSPKIFDNVLNSMVISSVVLKVYRGDGGGRGTGTPTEYLMITLNNCIFFG